MELLSAICSFFELAGTAWRDLRASFGVFFLLFFVSLLGFLVVIYHVFFFPQVFDLFGFVCCFLVVGLFHLFCLFVCVLFFLKGLRNQIFSVKALELQYPCLFIPPKSYPYGKVWRRMEILLACLVWGWLEEEIL